MNPGYVAGNSSRAATRSKVTYRMLSTLSSATWSLEETVSFMKNKKLASIMNCDCGRIMKWNRRTEVTDG